MTWILLTIVVMAPAIAYVVFYQAYGLWLIRRAFRADGADPVPGEEYAEAALPRVNVQLPVCDEGTLVRRVLMSAAALDYPTSRLQVQVLDDSSDPASRKIAHAAVLEARRARPGLRVDYIRRADRAGFKAGNLQNGLAQSDAPFIAVFDADFIVPPDFLRRTIHHFTDPRTGLVQARWCYRNDGSVFTRLQAEKLDLHQRIDQTGRARHGLPVMFHGTAGVWRRAALDAAGGWAAQSEVEDLEISVKAALQGWRTVYLDGLRVPSELPEGVDAYVVQHMRWRRGGVRCARLLSGAVLRAQIPFNVRLDLLLRLQAAWSALAGLVMVFGALPFFWAMARIDATMAGLAPYALSLLLSGITCVAEARLLARDGAARPPLPFRRWARVLPLSYLLLVMGMLAPLTLATLQGMGRRQTWVVTPKTGGRREARRRALRPWIAANLGMAACAVILGAVSLQGHHPLAVIFVLGFAAGCAAVGLAAWREGRGHTLPWQKMLKPGQGTARATVDGAPVEERRAAA